MTDRTRRILRLRTGNRIIPMDRMLGPDTPEADWPVQNDNDAPLTVLTDRDAGIEMADEELEAEAGR